MKVIKIILISLLLILIQYLSQSLFILKYLNWIIVVCISLFWFGDYKKSIVICIVAGLIFDALVQGMLGITMLSVFFPLLIMVIIDNLIRIESFLSKLIIAEISLILAFIIMRLSSVGLVDINDFTFRIKETMLQIVVSGVVLLLLSLLLQSRNKKDYGFRIRGI